MSIPLFSDPKDIIAPDHLVAMDENISAVPMKIDLVYAQADHPENIFKETIYKSDARLWLHRDMSEIVFKAAELCYQDHGYVFILRDGLRPVEAQQAMQETEIVKQHPEWCTGENRLLSKPGQGGHPRGMAIDITLETKSGETVPMGTGFDEFTKKDCGMPVAHRDNQDLSADVLQNRKLLEDAMVQAAQICGKEILPLPQEWWDFRFKADIVTKYMPISDADLPDDMKMVL